MKRFFQELRRRNVYRVAAIYIIVAWAVMQVIDVFMEFMPLPPWTPSLVFVLLVAGFPVALVLAWAFELTPQGLRPDTSVQPSLEKHRNRAWDWLIGLGLVIVVAYWGLERWQQTKSPPEETSGFIDSIVVLPLDNLMNDPGQGYFVEGMHDALITELSRIAALRVVSRTSALRFRDTDKSLREIASELDVDAVIEGSVLRVGNQVRINVQMIDAVNDRHLWGEQFDRQLSDILALYSEVTRRITDSIAIRVNPGEAAHLANTMALDAGAYDQYLRGRDLCDRWTPESMRQGIELMRDAVRQNPDFAPLHAGLAQCLQYASFYEYIEPAGIAGEALSSADRAVMLDPGLDAAHVAKASVYWYLDYDASAAENSLRRALELNPEMARAQIHYSWLLGELGRFEEARQYALKAIASEPFATQSQVTLGQLLFLDRDFGGAERQYRAAMALDPGDPTNHLYLAWALEQAGDLEGATESVRRAVELSNGEPLYQAFLGYLLGQAGQVESARAVLGQLTVSGGGAFNQAIVELGLGQYDRALDSLEKAFEERSSHLVYLPRSPHFDPLRGMQRFEALVDRIENG